MPADLGNLIALVRLDLSTNLLRSISFKSQLF
jgi:Leucine-rich repeat (LRR) protein